MRGRLLEHPEVDGRLVRRRVGATGSTHPVLQLQRTAGNRAVTQVLQRDKAAKPTEEDMATFFFSKVAMGSAKKNYQGKCNAKFDGVRVERHWEWGLLYDDIAVVFQCGPQRFRFETARTGDGDFPWSFLDARGGVGGWVTDPVKGALQTIYDRWDDERRFHAATRVIIDALKFDVETYCKLDKEYRRKKAAEGGDGGGFWDRFR